MVKLANTLDLGSSAERLVGSSPTLRIRLHHASTIEFYMSGNQNNTNPDSDADIIADISSGDRKQLKEMMQSSSLLAPEVLASLTPEERKEVDALQDAWKDVVNSMGRQPVIHDIDDVTGVRTTVWLGEWVYGSDAGAKVEAITKAKMEEYDRIGVTAFEDTLPLEGALKPGECRIVPPLDKN